MTAPPMDPTQMNDLNAPPGSPAVWRDLFGPEALGVNGQGVSQANQIAAPNPPDDSDTVEPLSQLTKLMAALYGDTFPLIRALNAMVSEQPELEQLGQMPPLETLLARTEPDEWVIWVRSRWALHRAAVEMHLWLVSRNRLYRADQQWVSAKGREPWREPARPTESARVVDNCIRPPLDQRMQVIADQRPGFQVEPKAMTPEEKRKAEGQQLGLEFQWDSQHMDRQVAEAAFWAGTDGVAFWETVWDRDAGPWDERMGNQPGQRKPLGDLRTKTRRCEQVRVSANATATEPPYYAIIRDVLSGTEAAYVYGASGAQSRATTTGDISGHADSEASGASTDVAMPSWVLNQTTVGEGNRLNNIATVERFTMYVDRHPDVLPEGLQIVVLGNAVVWGPGELLFGCIPVVPVRDGSTDPSYYPRPLMEQWIPPQQRINAALSLWVNSLRVNSGGRFAARPDAISRETFIGSGLSILEVQGAGPLSEQMLPIQGFSVGEDVKELIDRDKKSIEDMSGWNDVSRGQVSNETATAVATANEQIARIFTPPVTAVARAAEDWGRINLAGMAWGYDLPRDLGSVGSDRPDLARALSAKDFDGPGNVKVDPAKMIPMPRMYRQLVLNDYFAKGLITAQQFMRNQKFGSIQHLESPDEDQTARAKRVADAIRLQLPPDQIPPLRWQTNEAIEQDVLERDILLQDDLPPEVIQVANQRWLQAAQQAAMKQGGQPPGAPMPNTAQPTDPTQLPQGSPPGGPSSLEPPVNPQDTTSMSPGGLGSSMSMTDPMQSLSSLPGIPPNA